MNTYRCLNQQEWHEADYSLVPLREADIFLIKNWRNAQIDVLRQKRALTDDDQRSYYQKVIQPLFDQEQPNQLLFSLLYKNECIGYGGLVYVSWEDRRAEVSFLVDDQRAAQPAVYRQDFLHYLTLIKRVALQGIHFHRIFTETFDIRDFHISILEESGFVVEGRMRDHVCIQGEFKDSLIHGFLLK